MEATLRIRFLAFQNIICVQTNCGDPWRKNLLVSLSMHIFTHYPSVLGTNRLFFHSCGLIEDSSVINISPLFTTRG